MGGTWHWIVLIAAAPRQPHRRLPDAHWLSEGRGHTCGPRAQHRRTVINMSWVNILDICASFHLQIPQCGVLFPSSSSCLTHSRSSKKYLLKKYTYVMSAEMIHIQFQEQSYINSIDKKNNKSQARVKGNNFEE